MLRMVIVVCGILLGLLAAAIVVATLHSDVITGLQYLIADPWGAVTLLDLGVGLLFVAAWITVVEPHPRCAVGWIIALFLLGNVVTLVYLLWRTRSARQCSDLFLPPRRNDWTES